MFINSALPCEAENKGGGVINVSSTIRYKIKVAMISKKGHQLQQLHPAEKHHEMSGYMHR